MRSLVENLFLSLMADGRRCAERAVFLARRCMAFSSCRPHRLASADELHVNSLTKKGQHLTAVQLSATIFSVLLALLVAPSNKNSGSKPSDVLLWMIRACCGRYEISSPMDMNKER